MIGMCCKKTLFWLNAMLCFPVLKRALLGMCLPVKGISLMSACRALDPVGQMLSQLLVLQVNNRLWINYYSVFPILGF